MRILMVMVFCLLTKTAFGHATNNAFLVLHLEGTSLSGALQLRLVDLPLITAVDADRNLELTWGEIKAARHKLGAYVERHLQVRNDAGPCALEQLDSQIEQLSGGVYLHIPLQGTCLASAPTLSVNYHLLFANDAAHRGLMVLHSGETSSAFVFSPGQETADIALLEPEVWPLLATFLEEGVWHIWKGYDHLMFLIALLVPMFLPRKQRRLLQTFPARTQPQVSAEGLQAPVGRMVVSILRIVTAFTVAHSITLILTTVYQPPLASAMIETLIAASVLLAGINMLRPVFDSGHWRIAFCFGLIHGLGFASALRDLTLPTQYFVESLLSFNVGVELGQLAIVVLCFPLLLWLSRHASYRRVIVPGLAAGVIGTSLWWTLERATQI